MREILYIRWRDQSPPTLPYALVQGDMSGSVVVDRATPDALLALAATRRVVLFVPGTDVQLASCEVPTRQTGKILQAVPYLLEEQLAEDVEALHFAIGARQSTATYPVAVVARSKMDAWLAPFRERGIDVAAIVPEPLCLPQPAGDDPWPVLVEPDLLTIRSAAFYGFSCPPRDAALYLDIAETGTKQHALALLLTADCSAKDFAAGGREVVLRPGYQDPLQALVQHYRPSAAIDLLQGSYSRRANLQRLWQPWRLAAALLVAVLALGWLSNVVDAIRFGNAAQAQDAANAARFHALFPDEPASLELSLAIQQVAARNGGSGDASLLGLLRPTATALAAASGLSVQELQYHDRALYVNLAGSDVQALDRLRTWFADHSQARLDVQSANATGDGVQIVIKVTAS